MTRLNEIRVADSEGVTTLTFTSPDGTRGALMTVRNVFDNGFAAMRAEKSGVDVSEEEDVD